MLVKKNKEQINSDIEFFGEIPLDSLVCSSDYNPPFKEIFNAQKKMFPYRQEQSDRPEEGIQDIYGYPVLLLKELVKMYNKDIPNFLELNIQSMPGNFELNLTNKNKRELAFEFLCFLLGMPYAYTMDYASNFFIGRNNFEASLILASDPQDLNDEKHFKKHCKPYWDGQYHNNICRLVNDEEGNPIDLTSKDDNKILEEILNLGKCFVISQNYIYRRAMNHPGLEEKRGYIVDFKKPDCQCPWFQKLEKEARLNQGQPGTTGSKTRIVYCKHVIACIYKLYIMTRTPLPEWIFKYFDQMKIGDTSINLDMTKLFGYPTNNMGIPCFYILSDRVNAGKALQNVFGKDDIFYNGINIKNPLFKSIKLAIVITSHSYGYNCSERAYHLTKYLDLIRVKFIEKDKCYMFYVPEIETKIDAVGNLRRKQRLYFAYVVFFLKNTKRMYCICNLSREKHLPCEHIQAVYYYYIMGEEKARFNDNSSLGILKRNLKSDLRQEYMELQFKNRPRYDVNNKKLKQTKEPLPEIVTAFLKRLETQGYAPIRHILGTFVPRTDEPRILIRKVDQEFHVVSFLEGTDVSENVSLSKRLIRLHF